MYIAYFYVILSRITKANLG